MTVVDRPPEQAIAPRGRPRNGSVQSTFTTFDGTELFYRAWLPTEPVRRALILLHRGHEHSGRYDDFVAQLDLPDDTAVFAHDARGHGRSPGERGYASTFATLVKDVDTFAHFIAKAHDIPINDMLILGHSVGAVVAAAWVHDYAPPVRGMVLATPALKVKLYVPLAMPALRARNAISRKPSFIKSYVRSSMLTHDPAEARAYDADPLVSKQIAVNVLIDLRDTADRLLADAGAIRVPTLVQTAGKDWVVNNRAAKLFLDRLGSSDKSVRHYDGFGHAIYHEKERDRAIDDVRAFVFSAFERESNENQLLHADRAGYTRDEYDRLSRPRSLACPKRAMFAIQTIGMKTGGRLSRGISLGWRTGFDSGESLDHVYRDAAQGFTPLGRLIDRCYLNTIGWRGIRQRKANLMALLSRAIEETAARGEPVRIVDIASGPGRYLLETLKRCAVNDVHATLRDRSEPGLQAARALAREMGVTNVTCATGDAFDQASLATIAPRPNIGIVSGLYELFPANAPIRASLAGLASAIAPGGYLIYTNQPWHPQVEMIARCLLNRDGKPWIMRRRTQAEMDALVRAAGFEKVTMEIDRWGIFTVSLARRALKVDEASSSYPLSLRERGRGSQGTSNSESPLILTFSQREKGPKLRTKLLCCAVMSAAFLISYGGCLRITAARAPVPSLAFAWERYTPFIPAMIVPYWSIDMFFVGSFFLCTRLGELRTHVKRLALAMVVASTCFLLFPLQMAYPRPIVDGFWAIGFAVLHAFDRPYNLAPSLHIALWTILLAVYVRHTRGWLRVAIVTWFALIYVSTLLTWQHQAFDVITGQALGVLALYLFRDRDADRHPKPAS